MANTPNLDLTLMTETQGEKYVTFNSALQWLELMTPNLAVVDIANEPASGAVDGDAYIVSSVPAGEFSTFSQHQVAALINGAWEAKTPRDGWTAHVQDVNEMYYYNGSSWVTTSGP